MAWNGTKTWAVSDTLTASDLNSYVRDNTAYLYQKAEVAMKHTGTNCTTAVTTTVSFTSGTDDIFDTFGMHVGGSATRLSVVTGQTGTYWCWANGLWAANTTGRRFMGIRKNGSEEIGREDSPTDPTSGEWWGSVGAARLMSSVGDYIELLAFQTSGGTLSFETRGFGMWHVGS